MREPESPLVLRIQAEPRDVNPAAEVAEPLIERDRRAKQQVGHGIVGRKRRREDVERVGRDRLNHVDPGAPELAADLDEMAATGPGQAVLDFEGVLRRVARTGDRAADRRIAADVEEGRTLADVVRGVVAEPERARRRPVEALVEEELVPQVSAAHRVGQRWRKDVGARQRRRMRRDVVARRKARHVGAADRDGVDVVPAGVGVAAEDLVCSATG